MKTQRKRTVLAVDDDEINLMILIKCVQESGFNVKSFTSGEAAWEYLQANKNGADIALLDKMMPGMSGLDLLKHIKNNEALRHIPVIMQTGDVGVSQMREGLENGAYYYLTKPFHPEILTAILNSAANECNMREEMLDQMSVGHSKFIGLLQEGEFIIRTHADARLMAATISQAATYPEFVALGIMELLTNAIEHGNLGVGYEQKRKCLLAGSWDEEVAARLEVPEYAARVVRLRMEKTLQGMHIVITDQGKGFNWQHFMHDEDAPGRLNEPNGRGIAKAMIMLDDLRYTGRGNEVECNVGMPSYLTVLHEAGTAAMAANQQHS